MANDYQQSLDDLISKANTLNKKLSTKKGLLEYGIDLNNIGSIDPELVKTKLLTDMGLLQPRVLTEAETRYGEPLPPVETYQDVLNKKLDTLLGKTPYEDVNTTYSKALERIGSADTTIYPTKEEADKAAQKTETLAFLDAIAQQGDKTVQQSLVSPIGTGKALYNILKDTYRDVTSSEDPNKISVADLIAGKRPPEPESNTLADYARYTGGTLAGMLGDTTQAIRSIPGFKSVEPYLLGPDVDKSLSEVEGYREMADASKKRLEDKGLSTSLFKAPSVPVIGAKSAALDTLLQNIEGLGDIGNLAAMGGAALAGPAAGGALATSLFAPPMIKHEGELLSKLLAGKGSEEETARDLTQLGINTLMLGLMGAGAKAEGKSLIKDLLKGSEKRINLNESIKDRTNLLSDRIDSDTLTASQDIPTGGIFGDEAIYKAWGAGGDLSSTSKALQDVANKYYAADYYKTISGDRPVTTDIINKLRENESLQQELANYGDFKKAAVIPDRIESYGEVNNFPSGPADFKVIDKPIVSEKKLEADLAAISSAFGDLPAEQVGILYANQTVRSVLDAPLALPEKINQLQGLAQSQSYIAPFKMEPGIYNKTMVAPIESGSSALRRITDPVKDLFPYLPVGPMEPVGFKAKGYKVISKEPIIAETFSAKPEIYEPTKATGRKNSYISPEIESFTTSIIEKLKDEGGWIDPFGRGKRERLGREDAEYIPPSSSEVGGASLLSERSYEDYFRPVEIAPEVLDGFKKVTLDMPITELNKPVKQRAVEAAYNEFADMMKQAKRFSPEKLQKQGVMDIKAKLKTLPKTDQANLMQDIGYLDMHLKPIRQMIDRVAEHDPVKHDALVTKLDTQTTDAVSALMTEIKDHKSFAEKVKKDVKANSEMDAAIKGYGEKIISEDQLINKFGKTRAEKIKAYAEEFRRRYDQILRATNEVLTRYGKEPIKYRKDYFTHATEIASFWERLNREPSQSSLGGLSSAQQKYTTKNLWNRFSKERKTEAPHINSAIIAFDSYLIPTLKQKHLTPVIETYRGVVEGLKTVELETGVSLTRFKDAISETANIIAGGVHPWDAPVKNAVHPALWNSYKLIMDQIGKNAIIGNAGVGLAQTLNAPVIAAKVGTFNYTKGLVKQFFEQFNGAENFAAKHSGFLKNRYTDISPVVKTLTNKAADFVSYLPHQFERFLTESAWRGAYEKVRAENPKMLQKELFRLADEMTAKLVGDRSIGKKALAFESEVAQIPLQFQLEVNTLFQNYKDMFKAKDIGGLAKLATYAFAFNSLYESITGRRPLFDPIQATYEAVTDKERTPMQRVGRVAGEFLNAVPGSSALTMFIPEEKRKKYFGGTEIGMYGDPPALSTLKRILGAKDIQTAGTNALTSIGLPFGGAQVGKTMRGYKLMKEREESGEPLSMQKSLKALILGPSAAKDMSSLQEIDARIAKQKSDTKEEYDKAKKIYNEMKVLNDTRGLDAVNSYVANLKNTDPSLYEKLLKVADNKAKGINDIEEKMQQLGVTNKSRSKFIKDYLDKKFKTNEDKNNYVNSLIDKEIITDEVLSQLRELYKGE